MYQTKAIVKLGKLQNESDKTSLSKRQMAAITLDNSFYILRTLPKEPKKQPESIPESKIIIKEIPNVRGNVAV
jgi:hypothetical protein